MLICFQVCFSPTGRGAEARPRLGLTGCLTITQDETLAQCQGGINQCSVLNSFFLMRFVTLAER